MDGPMVHWWYKCDVVGLVGMFSNSHVSGQNVIFVHTIGASLLMKWHLSDDEGIFCETVRLLLRSGEAEVSFSEQGAARQPLLLDSPG